MVFSATKEKPRGLISIKMLQKMETEFCESTADIFFPLRIISIAKRKCHKIARISFAGVQSVEPRFPPNLCKRSITRNPLTHQPWHSAAIPQSQSGCFQSNFLPKCRFGGENSLWKSVPLKSTDGASMGMKLERSGRETGRRGGRRVRLPL